LFDQPRFAPTTWHEGFATYDVRSFSTKLKVTGIDCSPPVTSRRARTRRDVMQELPGRLQAVILRDKKIIGARALWRHDRRPLVFSSISRRTTFAMRERLVSAAANLAMAAKRKNSVAAMSDDAEICGCNGVCKGGLSGRSAERNCSRSTTAGPHQASSSCGSCTGLVEQVLAFTLGRDYSRPEG